MVTLEKIGSALRFTFTDSQHYLYNDGTVDVPINALTLVLDEANMANFYKASSNDNLFSIPMSELGQFADKDALQAWFEENACGDSGMAPEDVEELIDERVTPIEEELDALDGVVTAHTGNSEIHVTAQDKQNWNGKASQASVDALQTAVNAHTSNIEVHVTAADKQNWNAKADQATVDALQNTVTAHTSDTTVHVTAAEKTTWNAKADASDIENLQQQIDTKEEVVATALNDLNEGLDTLEVQLEGKPDITDIEAQFEVAAIAMTKLDDVKADKEDTYTKSEVNALIQSLEQAIAAQLGGLSFVELTQAEYDALSTKQPHTVYIING